MTIDPTCTIIRTDTHVDTELGDEVIAMSVQSGMIFSFVETAREIWTFLEEERRFGEVVGHMTGKFDVAPETCGADVARFIATLAEHGMVRVTDGNGSTVTPERA